jgi:thiamine biosynthesis protein ThiS
MELRIDNAMKKINFSGTLAELIKKSGFMREEVVVKVNGKLVPETTKLKKTDKVEIIKVVFGG